MSDTATRKMSERKVDYGILEEVDELPGRETKLSPIKELLNSIKNDASKHGKWLMIARYQNGSAATAAANVERQRRGQDQTISGWSFATRRVDEGANTGLFVKYDPSKTEGSAEERHQRHQAWLQERKDRAAALRAERDAKKTAEGSGAGASAQTDREKANKPAQRKAS